MLAVERFTGIYFYGGVVDFRKQIDGLSMLVQEQLCLSLRDPNLFIFLSRDRKKIKCLYWDRTGFALWQKRLEKEQFPAERGREAKTISLDLDQLRWLLDGINIWKIKRHEAVLFEKAG